MAAADRQRYRNARQETTSFGCRFFLFPGKFVMCGDICRVRGIFVVCGEICHVRGIFVVCGEICHVRGDLSCAGRFRPIAGKYVVRDEFAEC